MRIAEINMMHTGSTGKIMFNIAEEARRAGHEVWTFSPVLFSRQSRSETPEMKYHTYFGSRFENMIHNYFAKLSGFQGFLSWVGTHQLLKEVDAVQPDIVHLHNLHNRSICLPMLFRYIKKSQAKIVWTLHDCWSFTGQCPHFAVAKCDQWRRGCHQCSQIHGYPDALVDRTRIMWKKKKKWFSGVRNMTIVSPSQWLGQLVKESYLQDYPVCVISNGIDLETFKPTEGNFRERYSLQDKYILLGVAYAWGERKGLDVFVRLAKELDEKYKIVLVGTNKWVDEKLPSNIISVHRTANQTELAEIYSAADLFVNPTREDTFPTVNIEAIACGTPVLTFRTGGSPEILNEKSGSVVEVDDVKTLKAEIIRICEERPFTCADCITRAQDFDMKSKFKEYVALYENLSHCAECPLQ